MQTVEAVKNAEYQKTLDRIKGLLEEAAAEIHLGKHQDALVKVNEATRQATWKGRDMEDPEEALKHAKERAKIRAGETGVTWVVAAREEMGLVVVLRKSDLVNEKRFGLKEENILYDTSTGRGL
jgi:hypothetical protein